MDVIWERYKEGFTVKYKSCQSALVEITSSGEG